jgi:hypothetical protein
MRSTGITHEKQAEHKGIFKIIKNSEGVIKERSCDGTLFPCVTLKLRDEHF